MVLASVVRCLPESKIFSGNSVAVLLLGIHMIECGGKFHILQLDAIKDKHVWSTSHSRVAQWSLVWGLVYVHGRDTLNYI